MHRAAAEPLLPTGFTRLPHRPSLWLTQEIPSARAGNTRETPVNTGTGGIGAAILLS